MQAPNVSDIITAISLERLQPYRQGASGSDVDAIGHYLWNSALSEAFYPLLQALEVTLRNALHQGLAGHPGLRGRDWFDSAAGLLHKRELDQVAEARVRILKAKRAVSSGRIVAELSFGFWTTLLSRPYERRFWPQLLTPVFPQMPRSRRTRSTISGRLNYLRNFRNRVFHHEPIWNRPSLPSDHDQILETIGWMNPAFSALVASHDRFAAVHQAGASAFIPDDSLFEKGTSLTT